MRVLFTTLQFAETGFYRRVGAQLRSLGHEVAHVAYSRRAARDLQRHGERAFCLADALDTVTLPADLEAEAERVAASYETPTLRDVYRADWVVDRRDERAAVERTLRHFAALERIFDDVAPDVLWPELGSETMRVAAHLVARRRGVTTLYGFYTPFPRPLRLYADSLHAPIVPPEDVRALEPGERAEVERFIADFTARAAPIRAYRAPRVTPATLRDFARHLAVSATDDRGNDYLRPHRFVANYTRERARGAASRALYEPLRADRPFVYFPLHVVDDYKVRRVIPHCYDQASIIEQVAEALPHGYDLVLKEHPMSIGRNRLALLRRLRRIDNARLVEPRTSSHDLIQRAAAVAVISSTVGLEALFYNRPVLTIGQPYYSGYGVTVDVDSFRELTHKVPEVLRFHPDRERVLRFVGAAMRATYPGRPVLVDKPDLSEDNARALAGSIDAWLRDRRAAGGTPAPAASVA